MRYPKSFQSLITHFAALPSIGPKMAERIVLYLFKQESGSLAHFAESLGELQKLHSCWRCFYVTEEELCVFCADEKRDRSLVCVVEEPLDVIAIERTGSFAGLYHVLGGVLESNPGSNPTDSLRITELLERVQKEEIKEIIIATNPTTEGDLTALYLKKKLEGSGAKVTRIGRGMATGGDIEYADETTLTSALTNRKELS